MHGKGVRVFEVVRQENGACHYHQLKIEHDPRFTTREQDAPPQPARDRTIRDARAHTLRRRDTESATCCSARKAAQREREESGKRGPVRRESAGRDSVNWSLSGHKLAQLRVCVSACALVTFGKCVKHNEGVNTLISDFRNELAFIQSFSFNLYKIKTTPSDTSKLTTYNDSKGLRYTEKKLVLNFEKFHTQLQNNGK